MRSQYGLGEAHQVVNGTDAARQDSVEAMVQTQGPGQRGARRRFSSGYGRAGRDEGRCCGRRMVSEQVADEPAASSGSRKQQTAKAAQAGGRHLGGNLSVPFFCLLTGRGKVGRAWHTAAEGEARMMRVGALMVVVSCSF